MKKLPLFIAFSIALSSAFGQISDRENEQTTVKLGARPVAGTMALAFGLNLTSDSISTKTAGGNFLRRGDMLVFKRYLKDDLAFRLGLRLFKNSVSSKGDLADSNSFYNPVSGTRMITNEYKTSEREYLINPGLEKHYSAANIFDVFMGADLALGFAKDVNVNNEEYSNGDLSESKEVTSAMVTGVGGVVGFNVYIAHLPISLGLEYGFSAKWKMGGKTKVTRDDKVGTTSYSTEYYTQNEDALGNADNNQYSKLKKGDFEMDTNQNVKIILNIYFNK